MKKIMFAAAVAFCASTTMLGAGTAFYHTGVMKPVPNHSSITLAAAPAVTISRKDQ